MMMMREGNDYHEITPAMSILVSIVPYIDRMRAT